MAVGTPAYMSPEQAAGGPSVDGRTTSTRSAACCTRCWPASRPSPGRTPQAVIAKRVLEPVPHVRTLRESVPVPMEQALSRALAKAPADRFATAGEFARALAATAELITGRRHPGGSRRTDAVRSAASAACRWRATLALGRPARVSGCCSPGCVTRPEAGEPPVPSGWRCSPSRTSAGPRTSTSPTDSPTRCAGSSPRCPASR